MRCANELCFAINLVANSWSHRLPSILTRVDYISGSLACIISFNQHSWAWDLGMQILARSQMCITKHSPKILLDYKPVYICLLQPLISVWMWPSMQPQKLNIKLMSHCFKTVSQTWWVSEYNLILRICSHGGELFNDFHLKFVSCTRSYMHDKSEA